MEVMVVTFESERTLSDAISTVRPPAHEDAEWVYSRREFPMGDIIPDIVYVAIWEGKPSAWRRRWTYWEAHVLWLLGRYPRLRLATLARLTFTREDKVRRVTSGLIKAGAIEMTDTGAVRRSSAYSLLEGEVVAVESKLERWRDGLHQAKAYWRFADRVFVAVQHASLPSASGMIHFRQSGVGLLAVSPPQTVELIIPARAIRTRAPEKEYAFVSSLGGQTPWRSL